ncbi:peptidyl-prolyl cis-trans isomerase FKBP8-like [Anthonomus grandis grandis]|uniref:peptidyl-prolyl cis-trans isomerase FKBP8-like n=1 Tax=Anthonomus grandis grandis TaxID=2921223 RepID=UPI0021660EE2|nr:peptidyl-prolyl cis-trans isomerase FKBP8-like [Anthonomus grandis grandis]XP_050297332.1 peptidyl-prolyl cis-trans isomerase FKBP8-like [Anthonomus grandis grandis]
MSLLDNEKLECENFLENAKSDYSIEDVSNKPASESTKLILDEIASEKPVEAYQDDTDNSKDEALDDPLSEETESSRDINSMEKDPIKEEEVTENDNQTPHGGDGDQADEKEGWQDVLGSGVILKKILRAGGAELRPSRSDKCIINYTSRLEDADEEDLAEKFENLELNLGEGDVVQGLDVAIGLMNKTERCLLKIGSRLAYGEKGLPPHIPPNATVVFDVELVDIMPEEDCESLTLLERQKLGNKKRERGNWWYQRGDNSLAIQCYRRALNYLDEVESEGTEVEKPTDQELQKLLEDRLKVLNNMASAQIKMELYDQALVSLQTVLRCQPENVKALFRKAKVHVAKNDLPQALKLLEKAKSLEPEDPLITKEINQVSATINKQKNSEREYARRMFGTSPGASEGKNNADKGAGKSKGKKVQLWVTLGATAIIGLAGVVAYKFKYP